MYKKDTKADRTTQTTQALAWALQFHAPVNNSSIESGP